MYDRLVQEGHDARLLRFSSSDDGTVPGSHQNPKNAEYWKVGCLGITVGKKPGGQLRNLFSLNLFQAQNSQNR